MASLLTFLSTLTIFCGLALCDNYDSSYEDTSNGAVQILKKLSSMAAQVPCQPHTEESKYPPPIPHQVVNDSFFNKFDEVLFIGDVHGCFVEQQMLLKKAKADNDKILKIFSGDLTRGGPKNLEVIRFMQNCSSCLSVRGNNDEKTILKQAGYKSSNQTLPLLDQWIKDMNKKDIEYMRNLPYTISVPQLNAIMVHAGFLPGGVEIDKNRPWTLMNIRDVIPAPNCPGGWRPTRDEFITYPWASRWAGPQHIYFGHDHKRQLQLYPFATGVDTSCCRGHYMTGIFIYGPRNGTFVTQPALQKYYHGKV